MMAFDRDAPYAVSKLFLAHPFIQQKLQNIKGHYEIGARAKYRERLMIKRTAAVALDRKSHFKSTCEQWLR